MSVQPTRNLSFADLDRRSFLHPFAALAKHRQSGPRVITEGEGAWLHDPGGQRFREAVGGLGCANRRPQVAEQAYDTKHKVAATIAQCCLLEGLPSGEPIELNAAHSAKGLDQAAGLRADGIWQR